MTFHVQCDLSGGSSYPIANASITWAGLPGTGSGTTTPQSFVKYDPANPWPPTTIPSSSGDLTSGYVSATDSSGNATAYPTTPLTPGDWRVCTQQDAAGNCAVTYDVTGSPPAGSAWTLVTTYSLRGPPSVGPAVSCAPGTTTCVAVGTSYAEAPATLNAAEYSTDAGATWTYSTSSALTVGAGLQSVSCPTADFCVAVGGVLSGNDPGVILYTTNGGVDWTKASSVALPTPPMPSGQLEGVSCSSTTDCVAVGEYGAGTNNWGSETWSADALYTTDAGLDWSAGTVPSAGTGCSASGYPNCQLDSVSCPSTTQCVAVGIIGGSGNGTSAYTSDGGATWTSAPSATWSGVTVHYVSCPSTTFCLAVGNYGSYGNYTTGKTSTDGGATWTWSPTPGTGQVVDCPSTGLCVTDGGYTTNQAASWTSASFPGVPGYFKVNGLSCADDQHCVSLTNTNQIYDSP